MNKWIRSIYFCSLLTYNWGQNIDFSWLHEPTFLLFNSLRPSCNRTSKVTWLLQRVSEFSGTQIYTIFVVRQMAQGQDFVRVLMFSPISIIQRMLHTHLFIYHLHYVLLPNDADFNTLNPELNPICYLLALLGAHHFLRVSRIMVKLLTFRLLMSYIYIYIYGAPILDVSRSHKTTQHSR